MGRREGWREGIHTYKYTERERENIEKERREREREEREREKRGRGRESKSERETRERERCFTLPRQLSARAVEKIRDSIDFLGHICGLLSTFSPSGSVSSSPSRAACSLS